jgi:hypothetical protein
MKSDKIIAWWSGGITSAVACKIAIDLFGKENCRVIMIDTKNEDDDTYRFKKDCESWYGIDIEVITEIGGQYDSIEDVWIKNKSLNVASGAVCSDRLKKRVRDKWQKNNTFKYQVFGFEFDKKEFNRALSMMINHGEKANPIFPLMMMGYDKKKCIEIVQEAGIKEPLAYSLGFKNNNCLKTGCVQGGIGYWQKMKNDFPDKFNKMADLEHKLTDLKKYPVTMLKDQSKESKEIAIKTGLKYLSFVFLKKHKDYPDIKCIDDMRKQTVEPLFECNGFCGVNDLSERKITEGQINFNFDE